MQRSVRYVLLASLLVGAGSIAPAHAQPRVALTGGEETQTAPAPAMLWTGKFAYVGGRSQLGAIERAIEAATSKMGPLARRVARLRLGEETRPDARLRIEVDERTVGVVAQGLWRSPVDGSVQVVRDEDGDRYRVSQRIEGRKLFQIIRDDSLVIRNVFALSEDGRSLDIRVSVQHERIPEPLAYRLTYRRVD